MLPILTTLHPLGAVIVCSGTRVVVWSDSSLLEVIVKIKVTAIGMVSRIAPRDMRCSGCPSLIRKGRVYVKTAYGRYCDACGDALEPPTFPIVQQAALTPSQ